MKSFNTVVGTLGLIIAVIALMHAIYYNLAKIKLSNCTIDRVDEGYNKIYSFEVSNLSNVSIMVTAIELYNKQGQLLNDSGFDPYKNTITSDRHPPNHTDLDCTFQIFTYHLVRNLCHLNMRWRFSYSLNEQPSRIIVKTDKRIHKFRKKKIILSPF